MINGSYHLAKTEKTFNILLNFHYVLIKFVIVNIVIRN